MICKNGSGGPFPRLREAIRCECTGRCEPLDVTCHRRGEHSIARKPVAPTPRAAGFLGSSHEPHRPTTLLADGREGPPRLAAGLLRGRRAGGRDASSRRSSSTAPRSTSASRSSTTSTSCASSRRAGRSSSTTRPRCPRAQTMVLSAHGVAPSVHANAQRRGLHTIDATCPLVTKVHVQARRYAADGLPRDPDRPRRPRGGRRDDGRDPGLDRPRRVDASDVAALDLPADDEARLRDADDALGRRDGRGDRGAPRARSRRSRRRSARTSATRPRTASGRSRSCSPQIDLLLVIGSRNSSNSNRLVETARAGGVPSLPDRRRERDRRGVARRHRGRRDHLGRLGPREARPAASAPGSATRGVTEIEEHRLLEENIEFRLPVELRRELALADAQRG